MKRVKLWKLDEDFLTEEERDFDSYTKEGRRRMVEDDEMTPLEQAFIEGWDEAG
ncbi:hypothetical protein HYS48_01705 [Candidatus Woesearchaeota archaeon]|nr:hypothetical protein [Candidatus Woesearchaeota archaeon]